MAQRPLPKAIEAGGGHEAGVPAGVEEAKAEKARAKIKAKEKVRIKEKVKTKAAALEAGPTEDGLGKVAKDPKDVNLVRLDIGTADGARTAKEKEKEKTKAKEKRTKDMEKVMHTRLMAVKHSRQPKQHKRQKLRRAQNQQVHGVTKIGHKIGGGVKDMPPQTVNGASTTDGPSTASAG